MEETKKNIIRKKPVKWLLILLTICCVTAGSVCGMMTAFSLDRGYIFKHTEKEYEKSDYFYDNFYPALDTIITWAAKQTEEAKDILRGFENGKTNLSYVLIYPDKEEVFSNIANVMDMPSADHAFQEMRSKEWHELFYDMDGQSGTQGNENMLEYLALLKEQIPEQFMLGVSIDTDYPVEDDFARGFRRFQIANQYAEFAVIGLLVCIILTVWFLILLTKAAGRVPEDEEVHLNWFDRIYTEVAATLVFGFWITGVMIAAEEGFGYYNEIVYIAVAGFLGFYTAFWFLIGYLSLVRRIKAKTLWKQSGLKAGKGVVWKLMKKGWELSKKLWKKGVIVSAPFFGKMSRGTKRVGRGGYRILKEGFLDNMSDLAKLIMGFLVFLVVRVLLSIEVVEQNEIALFLLFALDLLVFGGILFYGAMEIRVKKGLKKIASGELDTKIEEKGLIGYQKEMAESVNQIGTGMKHAVEESVKNERMKTELLTNVSHDIKTPLTSIINYVDLLKRENIEDEKIQGYLKVLEEKSQRLKILTEDVVEASKASTGNITLEMCELNFVELIQQVYGEYEERLKDQDLNPVFTLPEVPVMILADGRRMWRVLSNVFGNIAKYSLEGTRVYTDLCVKEEKAILSIKNISREPLNISVEELTERFVRGDQSRTTEGSGLGLSIAKSFTELMGGTFILGLDGDLFKVTIEFPTVKPQA